MREEGFESVAVTSVFSPVSDAHEKRAAAVLREELGEGFPITLSSDDRVALASSSARTRPS